MRQFPREWRDALERVRPDWRNNIQEQMLEVVHADTDDEKEGTPMGPLPEGNVSESELEVYSDQDTPTTPEPVETPAARKPGKVTLAMNWLERSGYFTRTSYAIRFAMAVASIVHSPLLTLTIISALPDIAYYVREAVADAGTDAVRSASKRAFRVLKEKGPRIALTAVPLFVLYYAFKRVWRLARDSEPPTLEEVRKLPELGTSDPEVVEQTMEGIVSSLNLEQPIDHFNTYVAVGFSFAITFGWWLLTNAESILKIFVAARTYDTAIQWFQRKFGPKTFKIVGDFPPEGLYAITAQTQMVDGAEMMYCPVHTPNGTHHEKRQCTYSSSEKSFTYAMQPDRLIKIFACDLDTYPIFTATGDEDTMVFYKRSGNRNLIVYYTVKDRAISGLVILLTVLLIYVLVRKIVERVARRKFSSMTTATTTAVSIEPQSKTTVGTQVESAQQKEAHTQVEPMEEKEDIVEQGGDKKKPAREWEERPVTRHNVKKERGGKTGRVHRNARYRRSTRVTAAMRTQVREMFEYLFSYREKNGKSDILDALERKWHYGEFGPDFGSMSITHIENMLNDDESRRSVLEMCEIVMGIQKDTIGNRTDKYKEDLINDIVDTLEYAGKVEEEDIEDDDFEIPDYEWESRREELDDEASFEDFRKGRLRRMHMQARAPQVAVEATQSGFNIARRVGPPQEQPKYVVRPIKPPILSKESKAKLAAAPVLQNLVAKPAPIPEQVVKEVFPLPQGPKSQHVRTLIFQSKQLEVSVNVQALGQPVNLDEVYKCMALLVTGDQVRQCFSALFNLNPKSVNKFVTTKHGSFDERSTITVYDGGVNNAVKHSKVHDKLDIGVFLCATTIKPLKIIDPAIPLNKYGIIYVVYVDPVSNNRLHVPVVSIFEDADYIVGKPLANTITQAGSSGAPWIVFHDGSPRVIGVHRGIYSDYCVCTKMAHVVELTKVLDSFLGGGDAPRA